MADVLNVLLLEDNPDDAELLLHELKRSGFAIEWQRVETQEDYVAHLDGTVDLILADYSLPQFSAVQALRLLQQYDLDIPLIVVTGTVTEQVVVECLRLGASDYLLKDRLTRLGGAVTHALQEKQLRDEKRKADEALRRYAAELEQRVIERTGELQRTKDYVEAILNHTSDAILLASENGSIQHVNPAFEMLFGCPAEEILQQALPTLTDAEAQPTLVGAIETARRSYETQRIELPVRRSDGTTFVADFALSPIVDQGVFAGIVCSIRDISERKRVEENLRQALEKERELGDLKSRFSSMVSHEFRTPLSVIQTSSDLLKLYGDRMSPEKRDKQVDTIQLQVKRLLDLLNDILALGKAQSVGVEFNPQPLNIDTFCQDILAEIRPTATTHQFQFEANGERFDTSADNKLLRQAITNLLSNAVKYSPEGSTVTLCLTRNDDHIRIEIRDEGAGIPEEDQQHLFEAFFRSKQMSSIPGTGLGLPIVKQAIEAHGGHISFDTEVGRGTTFTLFLPLVRENVARP